MEKIRATYEVPIPQGSLALKAAFQASIGLSYNARRKLPG
jgi:hypothetical protein